MPARPSLGLSLAALLAASGCIAGADAESFDLEPSDLPDTAGLVCDDDVPGDADAGMDDATDDAGVGASCAWQSSDWSGDDWLPYPGKGTLHIPHGLGRTPSSVLVYISFDRSGASSALTAGDLARIGDVTPTMVEVTNATNSDYFCRIVLQ